MTNQIVVSSQQLRQQTVQHARRSYPSCLSSLYVPRKRNAGRSEWVLTSWSGSSRVNSENLLATKASKRAAPSSSDGDDDDDDKDASHSASSLSDLRSDEWLNSKR